jgi:hypothetical protein
MAKQLLDYTDPGEVVLAQNLTKIQFTHPEPGNKTL